jgi:hypothetical protein
MNCSRLPLLKAVLLLWFLTGHCFGQSNNSPVDSSGSSITGDSAMAYTDTVPDTSLTKIVFVSSRDSVRKWKRSPDFGYMAYLDTLLKKKKNELRQDTFDIGKNTNRSGDSTIFPQSNSSSGGFLNAFPTQVFFWIIAVVFVGFILYRLFFREGLFARGSAGHQDEQMEADPVRLSDYSQYNLLIAAAENSGDYNLAVRYLFLQLLKRLSERELIFFAPGKTNRLYVGELDGQSYQSEFAALTRNYEYVWYGKFSIDRDRYQALKNEFVQFAIKIA